MWCTFISDREIPANSDIQPAPPIVENVLDLPSTTEREESATTSAYTKSSDVEVILKKITRHKYFSDNNVISIKDIKSMLCCTI